MRYIIMCGGNYTRFDKPKQLTEIDGEPLVARTIRLLQDAGIKVIRRTPIDRAPRGYTVINDYTCDIDKPEDVKHD